MTLQDKLKEIFQDAIRARWSELEPFMLEQVVASAQTTYRYNNIISDSMVKSLLENATLELGKTKFSKALSAIAEHDSRRVIRERLKRRGLSETLLFPDEIES